MSLGRSIVCGLLLVSAGQVAAQPREHHASAAAALQTPASIRHEHEEIQRTLAEAAGEAGELGESARKLQAVLLPHFRREEEIATPPLALLRPLSEGRMDSQMRAVLPMTDALERELPRMLADHRRIGAARARLEEAARRAGRQEYVSFTQALAHHAQHEEDVLYPAAVLVGRHVRRGAADRRSGR